MEEFIVIDIPRSWKWTEKIATVVETVKDGFVYDTRYSAKWRHIRGVRLIVFSNAFPPTKALSPDRWIIIDARLYRNTSDERNNLPPLGGRPESNVVPSPTGSGTANGNAVAPPHGGDRRRDLLVNKLRARITHAQG